MAVWQFDFNLVPKQKIIDLFGTLPLTIDLNDLDWENLWEGFSLPEDYENLLDSFLMQTVHWHANTKMWGEEDGYRIEISKESEQVAYIYVRIHAGWRNDQFLEGIVRFAKYIQCVIIASESVRVAEPNVDFLIEQVKQSNAYKFVQDPQAFLENFLEQKDKDNENAT